MPVSVRSRMRCYFKVTVCVTARASRADHGYVSHFRDSLTSVFYARVPGPPGGAGAAPAPHVWRGTLAIDNDCGVIRYGGIHAACVTPL
jgi:hypothetical protein